MGREGWCRGRGEGMGGIGEVGRGGREKEKEIIERKIREKKEISDKKPDK